VRCAEPAKRAETSRLGDADRLDEPARFGAYPHAASSCSPSTATPSAISSMVLRTAIRGTDREDERILQF